MFLLLLVVATTLLLRLLGRRRRRVSSDDAGDSFRNEALGPKTTETILQLQRTEAEGRGNRVGEKDGRRLVSSPQ